MSANDYRTMIEGPAARATASGTPLSVTHELTERLIPDALPPLSFTLERLQQE